MTAILFGLFLIAHGAIHLLYLVPNTDDPRYPFDFGKSWLIHRAGLSEKLVRNIGIGLMGMTAIGFLLAGFASLIGEAQAVLIVFAAGMSLLLLVWTWDKQFTFGVLINGVLLVVALS